MTKVLAGNVRCLLLNCRHDDEHETCKLRKYRLSEKEKKKMAQKESRYLCSDIHYTPTHQMGLWSIEIYLIVVGQMGCPSNKTSHAL